MPEVKPLATLFLIPLIFARAELRLGIVGADSSEVIAFTRILNDNSHPDHLPGARVVAAYRGARMDRTGEELRAKWKVDITPDVGSLCRKVDGVLIGSGDPAGRLEQIKTVVAAGKPMFIGSPLAPTLEEARAIAKLIKSSGVPWFSASSVRFGEIADMKDGYIPFAVAAGPGPIEQRSEAVEMLYALMGTGCQEVNFADDGPTGRWPVDRIGKVRVSPDRWHVEVKRSADSVQRKNVAPDYRSLLSEIVKFFESGQPPVSNDETLEIAAFLDAAQRSKAAGGAPTKLR